MGAFAVQRCLSSLCDPASTCIYTLSLHDALPIFRHVQDHLPDGAGVLGVFRPAVTFLDLGRGKRESLRYPAQQDRKSTRLNSSHTVISYAVFCLKKETLSECGLTR